MKFGKTLPLAAACAALCLLSGCGKTLRNLTPTEYPLNPSGIYTLTLDADIGNASADPDSVEPFVVIDGQRRIMTKSELGKYIFNYEYKMPDGQNLAKYYYDVTYDFMQDNKRRTTTRQSKIHTLRLINRYVIQMESSRGIVGAEIAIVGRGFSQYNTLVFGDREIPIKYHNPNAISFVVPGATAGHAYPVTLRTDQGDIAIGNFMIDAAHLNVSQDSITLAQGEKDFMIVSIEFEAPEGGLRLDITTDIPQCIIMPETGIVEGARSVNVPIEGAQPGSGMLFVTAPGFSEVRIPLTVN